MRRRSKQFQGILDSKEDQKQTPEFSRPRHFSNESITQSRGDTCSGSDLSETKRRKVDKSPDYSKASLKILKTSAAETTLDQVQNKDARPMYMDHTKQEITGTHMVTMKKTENHKQYQVQTSPTCGARLKDKNILVKKEDKKTNSDQPQVEVGEGPYKGMKTNSDQPEVELREGPYKGMKGMKNQELATEIEKFSLKQKFVSDLVMKSTRHKRQS